MLLELLTHAVNMDVHWIVMLVLGNLFWVFALFAFAFISSEGKRPIWHFLLVVALLYALLDIRNLTNWVFVSIIIFLPISIITRIFLENTSIEKHATKFIIFAFISLAFVNTFYFRFLG